MSGREVWLGGLLPEGSVKGGVTQVEFLTRTASMFGWYDRFDEAERLLFAVGGVTADAFDDVPAAILVGEVRGQGHQVIAERERHEANTTAALTEFERVAKELRDQSNRLLQIRNELESDTSNE